MSNPLPTRRASLTQEELARANVPAALWAATLPGVTESLRPKLATYLKNIVEAKKASASLYIYGPPGVGKTGAGTVLLKEARAWGFTAYMVSVEELRMAVANRSSYQYDSEYSILDKAYTVDFLLFDDLQLSDATQLYPPLSCNEIRSLIRKRQDYGLVTIITSSVEPEAWQKPSKELLFTLQKTCLVLQMTGPSRYDDANASKKAFITPSPVK